MFELIVKFVTSIISSISYLGIFFLMAMESMVFPIPSEVVMPFVGYLVAQGKFPFITAAIVSALGCVFGSILSYYMGLYGILLIKKFGKYLLIDEDHLLWTQKWFKKHGEKTIFIGRFIPIVRHFISIPAGIGKMNMFKFILYTFIGSLLWNSMLLYSGILLAEKWDLIHQYSKPIDIVLVILIVLLIFYYIYRIIKNKNRPNH